MRTGPATVTEAVVILPHQLFERHPADSKGREVWHVEDDRCDVRDGRLWRFIGPRTSFSDGGERT